MVERNPDYWQTPAEASRVTFRFIPEFSARLAALLAGEIDIMKDVPPQNVEMLEKSGKARLRATVSSRINYLALVNLKPGPMQDLRVRKAIHHAVNVDELIQQVLKGRATKMCGSLSPINVDYSPKPQCWKYDPAQAQALFKEAGVDPTKLQLTLDTPSGRYPLDKDVSLAIAAQLQRRRHQDQRGGERVGHAPRQDQEPHHRRHVLPGLGPRARRARTPSSSSSRRARPIRPTATTRRSTPRSPRPSPSWIRRSGSRPGPRSSSMVRDEAPWVFLWQQHDLYGVANWIEWTPRADERIWMYEAKLAR